jgi:hypothetical protein
MKKSYKIINDPEHGFINIPSGLIQEIIEHPYFQRLRDIRQLGMTNLVYIPVLLIQDFCMLWGNASNERGNRCIEK